MFRATSTEELDDSDNDVNCNERKILNDLNAKLNNYDRMISIHE